MKRVCVCVCVCVYSQFYIQVQYSATVEQTPDLHLKYWINSFLQQLFQNH
jgi:hypothetical protein